MYTLMQSMAQRLTNVEQRTALSNAAQLGAVGGQDVALQPQRLFRNVSGPALGMAGSPMSTGSPFVVTQEVKVRKLKGSGRRTNGPSVYESGPVAN
jgi:hypothetical protein